MNKGFKQILLFLLMFFILISGVNATTDDFFTYYTNDNSNISGTTVYDITGTYNATLVGSPTTGVIGVDGEAIYYTPVDNLKFMQTPTISQTIKTLIFWINRSNYGVSIGNGGNKFALTDNTGYLMMMTQVVSNYTSVMFRVENSSGGFISNYDTYTNWGLSNNHWDMVAFVENTTNDSTEIFINGVSKKIIPNGRIPVATNQIRFNCYLPDPTNNLFCDENQQDQILFYNRTLTSTEILQIYNNNGTPYISAEPTPLIEFTNVSLINNSEYITSSIDVSVNIATSNTNNNTNISYSLNNGNYTQFATNSLIGNFTLTNLTTSSYNITLLAQNNETNTSTYYEFSVRIPEITINTITLNNITLINGTNINTTNASFYIDAITNNTNDNINFSYSLDSGSFIDFGVSGLNNTLNLTNLSETLHTIQFLLVNNETNTLSNLYSFNISLFIIIPEVSVSTIEGLNNDISGLFGVLDSLTGVFADIFTNDIVIIIIIGLIIFLFSGLIYIIMRYIYNY